MRIRTLYHKNRIINLILQPIKLLYEFIERHFVGDRLFSIIRFRMNFGYFMDLDNPKSLNEKIQWLKLNDRTELHTLCADKVTVRDYVSDKIGSKYLIPIYGVYDSEHCLVSENIPDQCIIKTNHDSGSYRIIRKKDEVDFNQIQKYFQDKLSNNFYQKTREWSYKNIKPKILVEKLLVSGSKHGIEDYKFHCFHGKVEFISIDKNRGTISHARNWYCKNWDKAEFYWSSIPSGVETLPDEEYDEKPPLLDEMIRISEALSKPFKYVRVDLYYVNNIIYFGELTFHHDSGFRPITPKKWDYKLGEMLNLHMD